MAKLHLVLLALICIQAMPHSAVTAVRIYWDRQTVLNALGHGDFVVEERLYPENCEHSSAVGNCRLAIDSDIIDEWTQCSSIVSEDTVWWKADLEAPAYVTRVLIHTTDLPDGVDMLNALNDFAILISGVECHRRISSEEFKSQSFPCDTMGETITVLSNQNNYSMLSLCEVEVFGVPITFQGIDAAPMELQLPKCYQASTFEGNVCNGATDKVYTQFPGQQGKQCAQTEIEDMPWWVVYFDGPAQVTHVKIFNRMDCCREQLSNFQIKVNGIVCAKHNDIKPFDSKILECKRFGSDLQVLSQRRNSSLTLCQVQVFGFHINKKNKDDFKPLGCFKDNQENPDFELQVAFTRMRALKCHSMCKRNNKAYFGLQNGQVCMCGNKYGRYGKADSEERCNSTCKGSEIEMCGGVGLNSVFEIIL